MTHKIYICFIISLFLLAGCGGGGGGGGVVSAQPATARVVLSTQGSLPPGKALSGIGVTLQLPTGVTPALTADGLVAGTVVKASGTLADNAGMVPPTYAPASSTSPATLSFVLASNAAEGFGLGEFATVTLNVRAGTVNFSTIDLNPSGGIASSISDAFKVTSYTPVDLAGVMIDNDFILVAFIAEVL